MSSKDSSTSNKDEYQQLDDIEITGGEVDADFQLANEPSHHLKLLAFVRQWCRETPSVLAYFVIFGFWYFSNQSIYILLICIGAVFLILLWSTWAAPESKRLDVRKSETKAQRQHDSEDKGDDRGS